MHNFHQNLIKQKHSNFKCILMSLLLSCGFHSSFGPPRCYAVCHTFHVASIHLLVHQGAMLSVIRFMWLPFIFWSTKVLCCLSYVSCGFHSSFGPPRCYAVCHTFHVASIHLLVHQGAMLSVIRFMWLPFIFWSTKVLCCLSYVSCGFHSSFGPPRSVCLSYVLAEVLNTCLSLFLDVLVFRIFFYGYCHCKGRSHY